MTPVLTCGDGDAALLEAPVGRGRAVVSMLRIAEALADEPAAAALLRNAVAYLGHAAPPPWRNTAALAGDDIGAKMALWSLGLLDPDRPESPRSSSGPTGLLVTSAAALDDATLAAAAGCLADGGEVVVVNPTAESAAALQALLGRPVSLKPADLVQLVPAAGAEADPLLAGLDLSDLCWLTDKGAEGILPLSLDVAGDGVTPLLVSSRTDWRRWVGRGENLKPGSIKRCEAGPYDRRVGLVRVRVGPGEAILSGIPVAPVNGKSMRVFGQMLTNLGASWQARPAGTAQQAAFYMRASGAVTQWLTLGPVQGRPAAALYAADLIAGEAAARPAAGELVAGSAWVPRQAPPAFDLSDDNLFGQLPDAAMYLCAYVRSSAARRALLLVGSDDDVKVWLNGGLVHANPTARPLTPDQDRVGPVNLREGWNCVLAKVVNRTAHWGFSLRVVDEQGKPFNDLEIASDSPEAAFREVATGGWKATSVPPGDAAGAFDRRPETRWTSGKPMDDTTGFTLDMGAAHNVRRLVLDASGSPGDYPRGVVVEASEDGQAWREVARCDRAADVQAHGVTTVTFPAAPARFLRIRQTGPAGCSGGLYWSIHELRVFE
jgi:hypothetical protein